jgi:hypothetical protein
MQKRRLRNPEETRDMNFVAKMRLKLRKEENSRLKRG